VCRSMMPRCCWTCSNPPANLKHLLRLF
jgi:hypothetical protein